MTTAHRPTWVAATAGPGSKGNYAAGGAPSLQRSAKDATAHTKLKFRQSGQDSEQELRRRNLKATLEQWEAEARQKKDGGGSGSSGAGARADDADGPQLLLTQEGEIDAAAVITEYKDKDDSDSGDSDLDSDGEDSEDDEAALRRELAIIKAERDEAKKKEAAIEAERAANAAREAAMTGNALLNPKASAQMKRQWNDDVVFKSQARGQSEPKKRFINDTIRNDFHRRFLSKYIK
ncbi:unnamed protein product [Phaeothamnion confervicola]